LPVQGVEVERQRGDEASCLHRWHFGDAALVQCHAAMSWTSKWTMSQVNSWSKRRFCGHQAPGGIFYHGKTLGEDLVEGPRPVSGARGFIGLGAELLIGQRLVLAAQLVDTPLRWGGFLDVFPMVLPANFLRMS